MRVAFLAVVMVTGILLGFFLTACAGLVTGLAAYKLLEQGVAAGLEVVRSAWPLFVGGPLFLAAAWYAFRASSKGDSRPGLDRSVGMETNRTAE